MQKCSEKHPDFKAYNGDTKQVVMDRWLTINS